MLIRRQTRRRDAEHPPWRAPAGTGPRMNGYGLAINGGEHLYGDMLQKELRRDPLHDLAVV